MFGKMMNRFYYGKSGKGDYTTEDLPETRWQLFWEMLRIRFASLFKLNLMYAAAWLPAMIVIGRALMMGYSGLVNVTELQLQAQSGEIAAEMAAQSMTQFQNAMKGAVLQTLLLLVPAIAITGAAVIAAASSAAASSPLFAAFMKYVLLSYTGHPGSSIQLFNPLSPEQASASPSASRPHSTPAV